MSNSFFFLIHKTLRKGNEENQSQPAEFNLGFGSLKLITSLNEGNEPV